MKIEDCPDSSSDDERAKRMRAMLARVNKAPTEAETAAADAIDRLHAVKAEIKEWRERATPTATDFKHQQDALERLDAEKLLLETVVKQLRGDFAAVDDVDLLQRVVHAAEARAQGRGLKEAEPAASEKHEPLSPETLQALIDGAEPHATGDRGAQRASSSWQVYKPGHLQGYGEPLYALLKNAHDAGLPKPNARDVLAAFARAKPDSVYDVRSDGFVYTSPNGTRDANIKAINASIQRMTSPKSKD